MSLLVKYIFIRSSCINVLGFCSLLRTVRAVNKSVVDKKLSVLSSLIEISFCCEVYSILETSKRFVSMESLMV